ncbi:MAG: U32 family peptidase [Bacteriovoracaceae bacterium]
MKLTGFAQNSHDLSLLKNSGFTEVILGMREYSRFGRLDAGNFLKLAADATRLGMRVIFDWDILMTEETFQKTLTELPVYLELADAVRVQDPGAFHWTLNHTTLPVHFIAESGNHNLEALKGWCEAAGERMERIVLSIELSRDSIREYCEKLPVPCELLGLGRILLFYSPRSLLSPLNPEKIGVNEDIEALGESEESPHKGFPVLENRHGTFMFHIKEFCLIDYASDLEKLGLSWLRIDQRFNERNFSAEVVKVVNRDGMFENFKAEYPQDLMRGFYHVNKSDVLFPKLKNMRLQNRSGDFIGEVLEAEKGSHLAILVKNPRGLKLGDKFQILHPKGEVFDGEVRSLRNVNLEEVSEISRDDLALLPYMNGVWVKSQLFLKAT